MFRCLSDCILTITSVHIGIDEKSSVEKSVRVCSPSEGKENKPNENVINVRERVTRTSRTIHSKREKINRQRAK